MRPFDVEIAIAHSCFLQKVFADSSTAAGREKEKEQKSVFSPTLLNGEQELLGKILPMLQESVAYRFILPANLEVMVEYLQGFWTERPQQSVMSNLVCRKVSAETANPKFLHIVVLDFSVSSEISEKLPSPGLHRRTGFGSGSFN